MVPATGQSGGSGSSPDQDLLDHDVEGIGRARDLLQPPLQADEIGLGIAQPVDMVDPQALDQAAPDQIEDQRVRGLEHVGNLDPQAGQLADVEEAAVVALLAVAPEGQAIGLPLQHAADVALVLAAGCERERRVVVGQDRLATPVVVGDLQLALRQDLVQRRAQHRQDQLAVGVAIEIDVEVAGIGGCPAHASAHPTTRDCRHRRPYGWGRCR